MTSILFCNSTCTQIFPLLFTKHPKNTWFTEEALIVRCKDDVEPLVTDGEAGVREGADDGWKTARVRFSTEIPSREEAF